MAIFRNSAGQAEFLLLGGSVYNTSMSDNTRVLYSEKEIRERIAQLALEIATDYASKRLVLLGVLKGSFVFLADLLRELHKQGVTDLEVDFMTISSYGDKTEYSGESKIKHSITLDIYGKEVLLVEDIIDTGYTLQTAIEFLKKQHPSTIKIVTLLDKPVKRKVELRPDYIGFSLSGTPWVEGYGLDSAEIGRGRSDIIEKNIV